MSSMSCHASKDSLHAVGMKVTEAREVLLQVLEASDHSLTLDEIYDRLDQPRPGRPTIYRNLTVPLFPSTRSPTLL
jgi:Fe2+ or Zn2+ uptake regulation protein